VAPAQSYGTGVALALAGAACWSLGGGLVRMTEGVDAWQIIFYRSLTVAILTLAWLLWKKGGAGTLNQTLGATALAAAPQLLNALTVLPFVVMFSLGTWTLLCNYMALRTVHGLSWQRSVAAALLPSVVLVLLAAAIGVIVAIVFGSLFATMFAGGLQ